MQRTFNQKLVIEKNYLKKKAKIESIQYLSINNLGSIPLLKIVVEHFSTVKQLLVHTKICNTITFNNVYKEIVLVKYKNFESFSKQSILDKLRKYTGITLHLIKLFLLSKERTLIYTPDYQVLSLSLLLKRIFARRRVKLVYHEFELVDPSKLSGLSKFQYNFLLKNSHSIDLVIIPEVNRLKFFLEKSQINREFVELVPNSCKRKSHTARSIVEPEKLQRIPTDKVLVGHIGTIGDEHFVDTLLEVMKDPEVQEKAFFVFVGRVSEKLKSRFATLKEINSNLIVLTHIPHHELEAFYRRFDLGLILYGPTNRNFRYCAPNKLYEYWSYGVPVVAHKLPGLTPIFQSTLQGKLIDLGDSVQLKEYLLESQHAVYQRESLQDFFNSNLEITPYLEKLESRLIDISDT